MIVGSHCHRATVLSFVLLLFTLVTGVANGAPFSDPYSRTADGISVYLGVMPAAIIRGHPQQHPEATMHGGPGSGWDRHVVIALFNAKTFERITDADVTATVEGLGHVGRVTKKLERMDIADAITFGGYFPFQGTDKYKIRVEIKIAGRDKPTIVTFDYDV
jgi:hypothetical protein